jgi:MFS family permease
MWTGPTYAMAQGVAKPHMRSMAAAIVIFMLNLVGAALGPLIVGVLNDFLEPRFGTEAVRYSLLIVIVPHTLASIFNLLAARTLREDLRAASA